MRNLAGTQGGKEGLWKKGQGTQEDYEDVGRLGREKVRRDKAQLEINLSHAVRDKWIVLCVSIDTSGGPRRPSFPLCDEKKLPQRMRKRLKYLMLPLDLSVLVKSN